jgi:hypothetical protein
MKKILLTTMSMFLFASAYGVTVFSENFDAWAVEPDQQDVLSAAGRGFSFYAEGYSESNDYIWGYYPGSEPLTQNYSVSGVGGAFADAVSGNALVVSNDYGAAMWEQETVTFRNAMQMQALTVTQEMIDAGTLTLTASIKSLSGDNGIHGSNDASNDNNNTTATEAGVRYSIGSGGDTWAAQTLTIDSTSDPDQWTTGSLSFALDQGSLGAWVKIDYFTESKWYSKSAAVIDNVSISAVPEPSTYALIAGFAAFLFVAIRRRK